MSDFRLRVLTYHRVLPSSDADSLRPSVASATPAVFREQMRHLARCYRVLDIREVLSALRRGRPLPARAVLVTFDDAYRDFGEVAWPILRSLRLPATLFVPTAFPDRPEREFWWDRLHRAVMDTTSRAVRGFPLHSLPLDTPQERRVSLRTMLRYLKSIPHGEAMDLVDSLCDELEAGVRADPGSRRSPGHEPGRETRAAGADRSGILGWDELRALGEEGVTLGPHTRSHPSLPQLAPEEARAEIRGAREDLQSRLGAVLPIFAYPFGAHDDRVVRVVGEEGFELAFTCREGHNILGTSDPLRLRRTAITPRTTPAIFRVRLQGWFSHVDRWRHRRKQLRARASLRSPTARQLEAGR